MRLHETTDFKSKAILQNFLKWWEERDITPDLNRLDITKKISVEPDGTINSDATINIYDVKSTFLPFKFGKVARMRLRMPNLETFHNAPKECPTFTLEKWTDSGQNIKLKSLMNCPQKSNYMSFEMGRPLENLQCSLTSPCEDLWIDTPEILSFAGLPQRVTNLSLNMTKQKSISGIKQLRNVGNLNILLPLDFNGGLLAICLIPGLQSVTGTNRASPVEKALQLISGALEKNMNVHDVQELMIESGFAKFARL